MTEIVSKKRKRIHISIPEWLDDDMREFIASSYHRYEKGPLSSCVIEALRSFLRSKTHGTHTQISDSKHHRYDDLMARIKNYLVPKYQYEEFKNKVIPQKHLDEAISQLRNIHDRRSIRDWRNRLEMDGYVERNGFGPESKQFKILRDVELELEEAS
jgi:hypothetical protein